MPRFEVSYKVLETSESGVRYSTGPSNYTVVVEAAYQGAAEQQVRNMNGGTNRCQIQYAKPIY